MPDGSDLPGTVQHMSALDLRSAAAEVLRRAKGADLSSLNEANTKALLIEPMLVALGWDVLDLDAVTREYPVYDGTFLDYALLVAQRPALFCEAKPTRKSLEDPKWVAQTINYANNEGVVWCVLTDGLRWRVFKANEAAPMEKKLAFEVHVADLFDEERRGRTQQLFACLTPSAVADGELTRLGTQVFVDSKVQTTLLDVLENPPTKLVELLRSQMGSDHGLKPADVRGALARVVRPVLDALGTTQVSLPERAPSTAPASSEPAGETEAVPARVELGYVERLAKWPEQQALHDRLISLLSSKAEVEQKHLHLRVTSGDCYLGGVEVQKKGLMFRSPLGLEEAKSAAPLLADAMVDVTGKGRWAPGRTEVRVTSAEQLPAAVDLLLAARAV